MFVHSHVVVHVCVLWQDFCMGRCFVWAWAVTERVYILFVSSESNYYFMIKKNCILKDDLRQKERERVRKM